jgi:hypothetical protein
LSSSGIAETLACWLGNQVPTCHPPIPAPLPHRQPACQYQPSPKAHRPDDVARDGTLDEEGQDSQATVLDLHHAAQGCKAQPFATQHTHASLRRSRGTVAQLPDIACAMCASLQAKQGHGGCRGARNSAVAAGVGRPGVNCHSLSLSGLVLDTAMPTRDWPPRTTYRGVVNENRSSASIFEIHVDTVAPMFPAGSHADRVFVMGGCLGS